LELLFNLEEEPPHAYENALHISALMVVMAVVFPIAAFSEDQKKNDGKSSGTQKHDGGKPAQHAAPHALSTKSFIECSTSGVNTTATSQQTSHPQCPASRLTEILLRRESYP